MKQLINGKAYDWSSIDIGIPGGENMEVKGITYSDSQETEIVHGKGGGSRGYGNGNYSATCDLTLQREDYNELCKIISKAKKTFYNYVIEKITVSFADEGAETSTDTITKVKLNGRDFSAKQGDKGNEVTVKGIVVGSITSNGVKAL